MLVLALCDLRRLLRVADIAAAMSVEALLGTDRVFAEDLIALRPQAGQALSAENLRRLLAGSPIVASHRHGDPRVQDAYSLRCAPQVTGAARDALGHAERTAAAELRSAIDNPMVLPDGRVESCGNFHGAPLALACDFLAAAFAPVGAIAERRTDRLLDAARSHGLPPFLADDPGVDSGLMIAHYTQAAMVAENRRLATPAGVDSLPTSAMQEDHVSMGWGAARKLRSAIGNLGPDPRGRADRGGARARPAAAARACRRNRRRPRRPSSGCGGPGTRPLAGARARGGGVPGLLRSALGRARGRDRGARVSREVRAPRGTKLSCRGWPQEAPLRMLMNNLDPEVAERPGDLVVYGGTGRAARSWEAFDAIVRSLRGLGEDETLLVQSGKPVGVFRTHEWAPRVLIANSHLVPEWATWEEFRRLEELGLTMYGQMTAGSWIYIGSQGIVQGTYECFAEIARRHFGGSLAGTITLTAGLGGMGGAQPLAVTMNEGVALCVEVDPERIERRLETRYLEERADDLEDAVARCERAKEARRPLSVGLCANAADVLPELLDRGFAADVVTDQTSAHDPLVGYLPNTLTLEEAERMRREDPEEYVRRARAAIAAHCFAMVGFKDAGAEVFDYGNSLRAEARLGGFERAFDYPGFVPAYIRPLFCEGKGPSAGSRCRATQPTSPPPTVPSSTSSATTSRWRDGSGSRGSGSPSRGYRRGSAGSATDSGARLGLRFNEMVRSGELTAPVVIGRDHLDSGSVASPYRETEGMEDGSRRDRGLAAFERARQHRLGCHLGVDPSWRRRRHRALDPRRDGLPGGRVGPGRGEARASVDRGPGNGRHAPCRRRLRARPGGRRGARIQIPMREGG